MEAAMAGLGALSTAGAGVSSGLSSLSSFAGGAGGMQGGLSLTSIIGSLAGGFASYDQAQSQKELHAFSAHNTRAEAGLSAAAEEMNATQEYLSGASAAVDLRNRLAKTIGGQRVAFAASGVDPTSGSAAKIQDVTEARAGQDLEALKSQTEVNRLQRLIAASAARRQGIVGGATEDIKVDQAGKSGDAKFAAAGFDALGTVFKAGVNMDKRG